MAKLNCKASRMCRTFKSAKCLKLSFKPSMGGGCLQRQVKAKRIKVFKTRLCYMRPCLPQCPPAYLHTYKKSRQSVGIRAEGHRGCRVEINLRAGYTTKECWWLPEARLATPQKRFSQILVSLVHVF